MILMMMIIIIIIIIIIIPTELFLTINRTSKSVIIKMEHAY